MSPSAVKTPTPRRRSRRTPPRRRWPLRLLSLLLAFSLGVAVGRSGLLDRLPRLPRASVSAPAATPEWVELALLPVNDYSRPGLSLSAVRGIVVHYVGNPGTTAQQNRSYFASLADTHETHASAHFVIGLDGEILQCVPLDELAYCSNDRNTDTISIECCHPGADGAFTEETYDALLRLTRYLVRAYGLQEGSVLRHYDVTGKACPLYFVSHPEEWDAFLGQVFR